MERVFVIGGAQVYEEAMRHAGCQIVHLTQVSERAGNCRGRGDTHSLVRFSIISQIKTPEFEADTFFPPLDLSVFVLDNSDANAGTQHEENGIVYTAHDPWCTLLYLTRFSCITLVHSTLGTDEERQMRNTKNVNT